MNGEDCVPDAPLLDLTESLQLGHGHKDNDGLFATSDVNLAGSGDLERSQFGLQLWDIVLQVNESLGDVGLRLVWRRSGGVGGTEDLGVDGHLDSEPCRSKSSDQHPDLIQAIHPIPPHFSPFNFTGRSKTAIAALWDGITRKWDSPYLSTM